MPRYVAMLGGINLGNRRMSMATLREHFESMGFGDVETLLASGNVLFSTKERVAETLERTIEEKLKSCLGYHVTTYVRSSEDLEQLRKGVAALKLDDDPLRNTQIVFLKETPAKPVTKAVTAIGADRDEFAFVGRELVWLLRGKISESQVWKLPEMKSSGLPEGTMRSWNTVVKIGARLSGG
jgi:uncharacterized protein (DUF1697 family)